MLSTQLNNRKRKFVCEHVRYSARKCLSTVYRNEAIPHVCIDATGFWQQYIVKNWKMIHSISLKYIFWKYDVLWSSWLDFFIGIFFVMIEFLLGQTWWKGDFILNYKLYGSCILYGEGAEENDSKIDFLEISNFQMFFRAIFWPVLIFFVISICRSWTCKIPLKRFSTYFKESGRKALTSPKRVNCLSTPFFMVILIQYNNS